MCMACMQIATKYTRSKQSSQLGRYDNLCHTPIYIERVVMTSKHQPFLSITNPFLSLNKAPCTLRTYCLSAVVVLDYFSGRFIPREIYMGKGANSKELPFLSHLYEFLQSNRLPKTARNILPTKRRN